MPVSPELGVKMPESHIHLSLLTLFLQKVCVSPVSSLNDLIEQPSKQLPQFFFQEQAV